MPALLNSFLSPATPTLKICGITTASDAERLAELGVDALGINFWDQSKRYCTPQTASEFLPALANRIRGTVRSAFDKPVRVR